MNDENIFIYGYTKRNGNSEWDNSFYSHFVPHLINKKNVLV